MRAPWLPDVLTDAGLNPRIMPGWEGTGRDMDTIYGVVVHDTVTPSGAWTNARVDALLRDGRSDLPGPLSQLGVDFDARPVVIADGRSNHNGYGTWGNDALGIEVYCGGGKGPEPWSDAQRATVVGMCRAILDHLSLGESSYWNPRVAGHKETDPSRKQDPYRIGMDSLRADIEEHDMTPDDMYRSLVPGTDESYALHIRHTLIHLRWLRTSGVPAVLEAVDAATQAAEAAASGDTETASARAVDASEIAKRVRRELAEALDG